MKDPKVSFDTEVKTAQLDWDDRGQPRSSSFNDVYFSSANGLAETRHVFLQHNRLAERFAQLAQRPEGHRRFVIAETGFGSGLNFLACWQLWEKQAPRDAELHFISVEKYPFTPEDLTRALALWPELSELGEPLAQAYPPLTPGFHRLSFGSVRLTLIIGDAQAGLEQLLVSEHPAFRDRGPKVDVWFLDGFAPARNPDMWTPELFQILADLSHAQTSLATFTAAGRVRRGLQAVGFETHNVPGFGQKREMLTARFKGKRREAPLPYRWQDRPPLPWPVVANPWPVDRRQAIVIGAGLAGCHSARALAERGWEVKLLEQHPAPAKEASGNPQGLLYAKLSPKWSPAAAFNLLSLTYAQQHYREYWQRGPQFGEACGLIQLAQSDKDVKLQAQINQRYQNPRLVRSLCAGQASELAGIPLAHSGLYFPRAGWLNPGNVCRALIDHPNIQVQTEAEVAELAHEGGHWLAHGPKGELLGQAPIAVLANARAAAQFEPCRWLALKAIRGQITELPSSKDSEQLQLALCGEGYLAPATDGRHCAGASFNLGDTNPETTVRDHQSNLENIAGFGSALGELFSQHPPDSLRGRVAFRCATPDYLPLVGPVADQEAFLEDYAVLRKDAKLDVPRPGRYWPGLFVNVGHGSRGLAYTPLSAELLAAHITGEPTPLGRHLSDALHPARLLIRGLMRNRV